MDLQFIDSEICESRLFRTTKGLGKFNGRDVANLLYINTLTLLMMLKDDVQHDYAKEYANQTTKYGNYALFRTHATDLYVLAYHTAHPKNKNISLQDSLASTSFLEKLTFDNSGHWKYLRELFVDIPSVGRSTSFFIRLETQLKISDNRYKQWRRLILDWENLKDIQRQLVVASIIQELRRFGLGSEMITQLSTMLKYRSFKIEPAPDDSATLGSKLAGAAIGAAAGRTIGSKVATSLGKDEDKYKKVGTGIGAIAGYWAAGRRRQQ